MGVWVREKERVCLCFFVYIYKCASAQVLLEL